MYDDASERAFLGYESASQLGGAHPVDISLGSRDEVGAWLHSQADAMRTAEYDHTETVASEVEIVNRNTALHRAEFSRQRADGTEINHMSVTYIITRGADGFRTCALLLHSP